MRPTPQAPFGTPANLGPTINNKALDNEKMPNLSADGTVLVFVADRLDRVGGPELWMTRRVPKTKGTAEK